MKTIIFDFGNVVGFFNHDLTLTRVAEHTHLTKKEMFEMVYAGDLEDIFEKGHIDEPEFLRRVVSLWQLRCPQDFLADAIADIFHPNPEVCELIPRLAGRYRLLLGSNTNLLHARRFRSQFAETLGHFDHLVLSCEIGARKPHEAFFRHCLRHANGAPQECLFIDDLAPNIEGARRSGMKGLVYRPGNLVNELATLGVA